jgi:hypothetical protein
MDGREGELTPLDARSAPHYVHALASVLDVALGDLLVPARSLAQVEHP